MSGLLAWRPAMMRTQVLDIIPTATNTSNTTIGAGVFNNKYVSRPLDINDFYTRVIVNIKYPASETDEASHLLVFPLITAP